jgi:DedD protein
MEDNDAQSQLRKVARRRLVGAVVFASVVAVVLPMVMDHEPRQAVQDVEIRIPGQDEKPFAPKFAVTPVDKPAAKPAEQAAEGKSPTPAEKGSGETLAVKPGVKPSEAAKDKPEEKTAGSPPEKAPEKAPAKTEKPAPKPEKAPEKAPEKPAPKPEKSSEKAPEKPAGMESSAEARRAAAILAGQTATPAAAPAKTGEFVIMIGAFANEDNVKTVRSKLSEKGVKSYVEPLDTPGGKKTRVRAGPFASREAAEQALERMKQVGVSGVISGK